MNRPRGITLVAALAAGLIVALGVAPTGLAQPGRHGHHQLVKALPKRWLRAHDLSGRAARPLADPDHDGIVNFVDWKLGMNPLSAHPLATAPSTGSTPVRSVIRLEGNVTVVSPTSLTIQLDSGLSVPVALPASAPVVDDNGFAVTLATGDQVKVFATQAADMSLTAVIVFQENGGQGGGDEGDDNDDDNGQTTAPGLHVTPPSAPGTVGSPGRQGGDNGGGGAGGD
jgi:hypothetical protein